MKNCAIDPSLPVINAQNISVFIPGDKRRRLVLRDFSWELRWLGHTAIYGANGSGKSTLLQVLHGLIPPCHGHMEWQYQGHMEASRITGQQITGMVSPQQQVHCQLHGGQRRGRDLFVQSPSAPTAAAKYLLRRLDSEFLLDAPLGQLSQGQLRMLMLVAQLLRSPPVLLLDEWATGLDQDKRKLIGEMLEEYSGQCTMIFTGHTPEHFPPWLNRHISLGEGPEPKVAPPPHALGASLHPPSPRPTVPSEPRIFDLVNVSVYLSRRLVLRHIHWQVRRGEHWRLVGPNGSGKSTLLRLLAGEEFAAWGGHCRYFSTADGREIKTAEERRRLVALVSDISQAHYDYPVTALELLLTGIDMHVGVHRAYKEAEVAAAREMLGLFFPQQELMEESSIRQLSTGQLRRLFLARALMGKPEVLLLDEPLSGLDEQSRRGYVALLKRMLAGEIAGIFPQLIVVSHEEDLGELPLRVAVLHQGRMCMDSTKVKN